MMTGNLRLICIYILEIYYLLYSNVIECKTIPPIFDLHLGKSNGNITSLEIYCPCNEDFGIDLYQGDETIGCDKDPKNYYEHAGYFSADKCQTNCISSSQCSFTYDTAISKHMFYCATMFRSIDYTTYYTGTIGISAFENETKVLSHVTFATYLPWTIVGFVFVIATGLATFFMYRRLKKKHLLSSPSEKVTLLPQSIGANFYHSLGSPPTKGNILVVYHNDNSMHFKTVQLFTVLLQDILQWNVVVDYNFKDDICIKGFASWTSHMIKHCNKIIVISSDGACDQIVSRHKTKHSPTTIGSALENCFLYSWMSIVSDLSLSQNYNKLFNIRFSYTNADSILPDIVSGRHFVLPKHLLELVYQLLDSIYDAKIFSSYLSVELDSSALYREFVDATNFNAAKTDKFEDHKR